ncbi:MAG: ABC transporter permease, partial [Synergistaceae bacterium]|nr:ABC transporter permease [Synergistaceae bacterium]
MWSIISVTLSLTALSMCASLILGLPLGFVLGYFKFPGRRLLRAFFDTMLALPTVVVGLLVYSLISNRGPLGDLGVLFTIRGMAIGQTILALPIVTALTASAIEGLDRRLSVTLATLGASGWRMAISCLWEGRFAVLAAAMTAYGRIVAEVGVSMMLGGNIK